jgi:hypothetical protein
MLIFAISDLVNLILSLQNFVDSHATFAFFAYNKRHNLTLHIATCKIYFAFLHLNLNCR